MRGMGKSTTDKRRKSTNLELAPPKQSQGLMNFERLSLSCLKKYRRLHHIRIKPTVPKAELAAAVAEHFASAPIPEEEHAIHEFISALQRNRVSEMNGGESGGDETRSPQSSQPKRSFGPGRRQERKDSTPTLNHKNVVQSNSVGRRIRTAKTEDAVPPLRL